MCERGHACVEGGTCEKRVDRGRACVACGAGPEENIYITHKCSVPGMRVPVHPFAFVTVSVRP